MGIVYEKSFKQYISLYTFIPIPLLVTALDEEIGITSPFCFSWCIQFSCVLNISSNSFAHIIHITVISYANYYISNYWQLDSLFNIWFNLTTKKIWNLCITGPWCGKFICNKWMSLKQRPVIWKVCPCHDIIMKIALLAVEQSYRLPPLPVK